MNAGILDTITSAFVQSLQTGFVVLSAYSIPLLAVLGVIYFSTTMWPVVLSGGQLGDALGTALMALLKCGVFFWLLVNLGAITSAAFTTFAGWGAAVSGGVFQPAAFLNPSSIVDLGFRAAAPIVDFLQRFSGFSALWNLPTVATYTVTYWVIVASFSLVALQAILTIVEFYLSVMLGAVLIPWGILSTTAFLAEFGIAWITAGLIRILLTAAILSIAIPLFDALALTTTPGGDPTLYGAMILALTSVVFARLAWVIPDRAAQVGGRGMAIGLSGSTTIPHGAWRSGYTLVSAGVSGGATVAARGASAMLRRG